MAAVVPPPLVSTTTSWEGVLVSAMDSAALAQAIEDLGDDRPIPGPLINRRVRLLEVLSFYDARPAAVLGVDGGGGGEERAEDGSEVDAGAVLAGDDAADVEINADESVMDDISPSDTDTALLGERVKELEKQNKALRRKARKHRSSRHRKRSKRHRVVLGSDSDSGSSSSSSSQSSLLSGDRERLDLEHERFHVLLRDLRSACAASSSSWSSAVRVFPSLASRSLFVRELQFVERAGIKADVFSSRQLFKTRRGLWRPSCLFFVVSLGMLVNLAKIEGCVRVGNAFSVNS
ncbi:hypothetical protein BC829DRAFT_403203 [Chytridium lagenaria]|nr:hypothetical protein BC829DRAFT_403203 [Chytridium lagenaria]